MTLHIQQSRMSTLWISLLCYGPIVGTVLAGAALFFTTAKVGGAL